MLALGVNTTELPPPADTVLVAFAPPISAVKESASGIVTTSIVVFSLSADIPPTASLPEITTVWPTAVVSAALFVTVTVVEPSTVATGFAGSRNCDVLIAAPSAGELPATIGGVIVIAVVPPEA